MKFPSSEQTRQGSKLYMELKLDHGGPNRKKGVEHSHSQTRIHRFFLSLDQRHGA
jgi:hypothetical protein